MSKLDPATLARFRAAVAAEEAARQQYRLIQMRSLRDDGLTLREIAEIYSVSTSHVYNMLNEGRRKQSL